MDPWSALLARAHAERELAAEGRWDALAASTAERVRIAAKLGPAPRHARLVLEALTVVQAELTAVVETARREAVAELGELRRGRGAVAGYAAAHTVPTRRWVDEPA